MPRFHLSLVSTLATLLLVPALAVAQPTPTSLTQPQGCVLDTAGALSASTIVAIEGVCREVAAQGHELAVVVIPRAGSLGSAQYALNLFNHWQLGSASANDGVLVFAAIDDRQSEILLGDGLDTPANNRRSDRVMMEAIVAGFRAGSPDRAMLNGARYAAANLFQAGEGPFRHPDDQVVGSTASSERPRGPTTERYTVVTDSDGSYTVRGELGFSDSPVSFLIAFLFSPILRIGLPVAFLLLVFGVYAFSRYRRRKCKNCSAPMLRLNEQQDDAHLSPSKQTEENIGSVDYDVWICSSTVCDHALEIPYRAWFTRYKRCGSCGARTSASTNRTISAATQHSTGLVEVTSRCVHCNFSGTHTRVTPRRPPPGSSGGGYSGGGGGGFSGGGGGGGHSSGGGSSGSW